MNPIDYWNQKYLKEKLTLEDCKRIVQIADELATEYNKQYVSGESNQWRKGEQAYYEEVLKRFNDKRRDKK